MRIVRTVEEMRAALAAPRRAGRSIGLIPTMGAFHDGHLSLIRRAHEQCELIVVSLFVNPAQFNESNDFDVYPRDERRDAELARDEGVDYLFTPTAAEVYPSGFATRVTVAGITEGLEGAGRGPGHFDGVATVVTKFLNIVGPDVAYFGRKDAQQALVIRRLVLDLNLSVRIEVCPTIRARDGLALSSRNVRLSPTERDRAAALHRALEVVKDTVLAGEHDPDAAAAAGVAELAAAGVAPEYLQIVAADSMVEPEKIDADVLAVVAARIGNTRLIDNILIYVLSTVKPAGSTTNGRH